jgi:hypothetical protein
VKEVREELDDYPVFGARMILEEVT